MRPARNIEELIKALRYEGDAETHKRILAGVLQELGRGIRQEPGHTGLGGRKLIMSSRIIKLATAVIIVVGLSIAISYISTDQPDNGIALGDVFKAMSQVTTITWTEIYEPTIPEGKIGVDDYGHVARCYFKAPRQRRREITTKRKNHKTLQMYEDERIGIFDGNAGKGLHLNPEKMTARLLDFTPKGGNDPILGKLMDPEATIPQDAEDLGSTLRISGWT
ncbi:MAG: hypothetical protein ACYS8Z_25755 [Planctomycetota bacterium]|jgi:hypothetical protein